MDKNEKNFRRERIIKENLLLLLDSVNISDRNKEIVKRYTAGESERQLSECYCVTPSRIAAIVACFLWHCSQIKQKGRNR